MKNLSRILLILIALTMVNNAQSKFRVDVMGDVNIPSSDMGDLYKTGFGGHAALNYQFSRSWEVGVSFGYTKWDADNDYWSKLVSQEVGQTVNIQVDVPYSIVTVMVDLYYYLARGKFSPYLNLSLGEHFTKIDANSVTVAGQRVDIGQSESKSVGGYKFGVGFLYNFTPSTAFNFIAAYAGNGLEFSQSSTSNSGGVTTTNSSNSTTLYLNLSAGVSIAL